MDQPTEHVNHLFCVLPPHLLRAVAENGTPRQRAMAARALNVDHTFRSIRLDSPPPLELRRRASAAADEEGVKRRAIYDCHHIEELPGTLARSEGQAPAGDDATDEAYDGLGYTHDLYWEVFERDSIDDGGMELYGHVHFGQDYDNAFWDGSRMIFGDGDGELFNRFTIAVDVMGHELTHGVTQHESGLTYHAQPGALNEHLSDVFGSLVKQHHLDQSAGEADWLIGEGLLAEGVQGVALRSMKEPGTAYDDPVLGKDPQPAHMDDYVRTYEDNGGVHINSGIPNRAFYLAAAALGGRAWERAGEIWYVTAIDPRLKPNTSFRRFARLTVRNAANLYGEHSDERQAVRQAWAGVGVGVTVSRQTTP